MARPQISMEDIELPTIDTPMADFAEQACGESYPLSFTLKQPYQGVGVWELEMPARAALVEPKIGTSLSDAQLGMLSSLGTDAAKAIIASQDLLAGKNPDLPVRLVAQGGGQLLGNVKLLVDPKNLQAIQHLIDRALHYGSLATQLWNYWANEWQPVVVKEIPSEGKEWGVGLIQTFMPHWPLEAEIEKAIPACAGLGPNQTQVEWVGAGWKAIVNCPSAATRNMHSGDTMIFMALMQAALVWARCAEEATAVVGLSALNRDEWQKTHLGPVGGGPQIDDPGPPPPKEGTFVPPGEDPGLPGDFPDDEGTPPPPPATTPAKPGLSTPVKVMGLGLLAWLAYKMFGKKK